MSIIFLWCTAHNRISVKNNQKVDYHLHIVGFQVSLLTKFDVRIDLSQAIFNQWVSVDYYTLYYIRIKICWMQRVCRNYVNQLCLFA